MSNRYRSKIFRKPSHWSKKRYEKHLKDKKLKAPDNYIPLSNIHHASTIDEAIRDLQVFLEADIWDASQEEWKSEEDAWKYLEGHFKILFDEIKRIRRKELKNDSLAKIWNNKKDKIWEKM